MKAHGHLLQKVSPAKRKKQKTKNILFSIHQNEAQMSLSHRRETFPSLNMPLQSSELRTITPGRRRAECRATPSQAQADAGHLGNGTIAPRHAASAVAHEAERVIAVELSTFKFLSKPERHFYLSYLSQETACFAIDRARKHRGYLKCHLSKKKKNNNEKNN